MNTNSLLLLSGVWGAALVSAAIAFQVHKPPVPVAAKVELPVAAALAPAAVTAVTQVTEPEVMLIPADSIVGRVARPMKAAPPPAPRDLSEMTCSSWTGLTQGSVSQQVRYCH